MQLRNQLLSYFFILVLAVLLIFGWNAYQFTQDSVKQIEQNIGQSYLNRYTEMLAHEYERSGSRQQMLNHLPAFNPEDTVYTFLVDQQNKALPNPQAKAIQPIIANWQSTTANTGQQGSLNHGTDTYHWLRAPVSGSPYSLVMLHKDNVGSIDLLQALSARLISIGLIVLWVAIWAALIISTVISRRLAQQQKKLAHLANYDQLTGLPNRHQTHELLQEAINKAAKKSGSVACIIMDLNRFKEINDALGHELGDRLLQMVAERLRHTLWEDDTVTRIGGDEFAMILTMSDEDHISQVVNKIVNLSDEPLIIDHTPLTIESTLGVATYPKDGGDADTLMRKAEVAMYSARETGSLFDYYRPEYDPHSRQRLQLTTELKSALDNGELEIHYQPKIEITSGKIIGSEALCRWNHPQKNNISPAVFIPVAEQTGIIWPLTDWVLRTALNQCAKWIEQNPELSISINLSARLLHDINLPGNIASILRETGFPARQLELELTETALMIDPTKAVEVLTLIHGMGVQISLDDFGSGYMSLSYLRNMPVDTIKIDMSFIRNMLIDDSDNMIVNTIIDLGHNLDCKVIAEGVENRETYDALAKQNCDAIQGYYISRPLPAEDFSEWLKKYKQTARIHDFVANRKSS